MRYLIYILTLSLIFVSCKENSDLSSVSLISSFNLETDIYDFKKKMNESDTIRIWVDHSVCMYEGYEKIQITKYSDTLKIRSEFKEVSFNKNPEWKDIYERKLSINDTVWKFEKFLERNSFRINKDENEYLSFQILHGNNKLNYSISDLVDLNNLMKDYFETMRELFPDNIDNIYGLEDTETLFLD